MNTSFNLYCFAALAVTLAACTSSPKQGPSINVGKTGQGTYALFAFSFEGLSQTPKCRMVLNQKGAGGAKQVQVYAFPSGTWGLIPLAAGTYSYDHIDCGFSRRYLITNPFGKKQNEFSLLPGKINYLGHTTLAFDSKDELKLRFDQKDHLNSIRAIFATLGANTWAANNMVSAYTQRNIRADMMAFDLPRSFSIKSRAPKEEQEKLKNLLNLVQTKIGKCADAEATANPLKIGALQVEYTLKNGKFVAGERRDTHVYSKDFINCAQQSMRAISYSADYPVSIDMKL